MRGSEDFYCPPETSDWIYVGGDIYNRSWAKVGKTTNGLDTRHRSPQNPGYFIYAAFNLIRGNVHEIESNLLTHLSAMPDITRLVHFSTGNLSECFQLNPREMTSLVAMFLEDNYGSCFTYENYTHGDMSRYQCRVDIRRYYDESKNIPSTFTPQSNKLRAPDYFTGNQEQYEINLGNGFYIDLSSCKIKHIND